MPIDEDEDDRTERDLLDESLGLFVELRPGKRLGDIESPASSVEEADYPRFRRLTLFAVLGGLCPLIPVPILDEWARERIHRRMVRELGESRDLGFTETEVRILAGAGEVRIWPGFVKAGAKVARNAMGKVVRKLFKTAFYALLVREGIHRAVETFVEGYLLLYVASLPQGLRQAGRTEERVRRVRAAVVTTMQEEDVTPIRNAMGRAFRRSFDLLVQGALLLSRQLSRLRSVPAASQDREMAGVSLEDEEELLGGFVDRLAASLWGNHEYFEGLEKAFEKRLAGMEGKGA